MATSKKKDRIVNLMQLNNTLAAGAPMGNPVNDEKLITFSEADHKIIMAHVRKMLSEEGIFVMSNLGVTT